MRLTFAKVKEMLEVTQLYMNRTGIVVAPVAESLFQLQRSLLEQIAMEQHLVSIADVESLPLNTPLSIDIQTLYLVVISHFLTMDGSDEKIIVRQRMKALLLLQKDLV